MFALLDHVIKFDAPFDLSPRTEEARGFRPTARIVFFTLAVVVSMALWAGMIAVVLSFF
ncbi:hypothetical protein [Rhizobium rhizosphaerae]|uniref:hypothetical protein n=1 Tax=Xaviernesmea rhizosphaerae TaxID=1672749 RepID=UPI00159475B2|nr:hypothetical protein [Xaviernesmea rhizosphaerae]